MLRVWGRANSLNVQKVVWCCEELGLAYERVDVGGRFGGTREAAYLALNPTGLIPTLEEDGFALWESNAIVRYLAARHGLGTLCPEDLRERARADRWMDWQVGVWAGLRPAFAGLVRTRAEARDAAAIEAARRATAEALAVLDAQLAGRPYVNGAVLTMADIALGPMVYRWMALDLERPALGHLEAWYARLVERPAFRARVMLPLS